VARTIAQGIQVKAWTFDELYGRDGGFLDSLQGLGQTFVAEVPVDFHGWVQPPRIMYSGPKSRCGRSKTYPRLARGRPASEVRNLLRYSPVFTQQSWQRYRIKDTDKGPEVWEVKWTVFWRKGASGVPGRRHCLIVARNVLTGEVKFFVANGVPGRKGVTLRWLLRVAFGRWSVESCFREAKEELGLDHYQTRGWDGVHRHLFVTQLSQLFCARIRQEYDPPADQPGGRLTVEQVRSAMNAWLQAIDLKPAVRQKCYEQELENQAYHQRRSQQARTSHVKKRIARLNAAGIQVEKIKTCRPRKP
jgi:SRSO17 transposase